MSAWYRTSIATRRSSRRVTLSPSRARCSRPMRVSTLIRSPSSTNSGTCTTAPVSTVAGLSAPVFVSPLAPGAVSVIVEHHRGRAGRPRSARPRASRSAPRRSRPGTCPRRPRPPARRAPGRRCPRSMNTKSRAVGVQVLHALALDDREPDLHARVERPLDHRAGLHVAELRADERAALARASRAGTPPPGTARRRAPGSCRSSGRWSKRSHGLLSSQLDQVARGGADHDAAVVGDLHHVLDAHAAEPRRGRSPARPSRPRPPGSGSSCLRPRLGASWISSPTPCPRPCTKRVAVARVARSPRGSRRRRLRPVTPARTASMPACCDSRTTSWIFAELRRRRPERDRARHVGVVAGGRARRSRA